jgi:hypothetical protein
MLPFSFSGRVEFGDPHDVEGAILRLERGLELLKAKRIDRQSSRIRFKGTFPSFVSSTNLLFSIGSGELEIQQKSGGLVVLYRLRFTYMLIVTAILFGYFGPIMLTNMNPAEALVALGGMWMMIFGLNVVPLLIRFPRWIKRTLA